MIKVNRTLIKVYIRSELFERFKITHLIEHLSGKYVFIFKFNDLYLKQIFIGFYSLK